MTGTRNRLASDLGAIVDWIRKLPEALAELQDGATANIDSRPFDDEDAFAA